MPINDGGPAFPFQEKTTEYDCSVPYERVVNTYYGMSLRDCIAIHAMNGYLSAPWHPEIGWAPWSGAPDDQKLMAESSYRLADAMLKAREEVKP